ncbi:MAG: hypothetical protein GC164_15540 [Phycisphaera sp.]|nr:hypothetical protein [Phycisphaera sp.]
MITLGLDIGSNSVGSAWLDSATGDLTTGISIFPAGVDESDDKRGEPKNAKRRMTRRTRITLARRAQRKHLLRSALVEAGLLPSDEAGFKSLLDSTDPWALRRKGLYEALTPYEFGRVLLHLSQRRGALGLKIANPDDPEADDSKAADDGKVKAAIGEVRSKMLHKNARTFGEFIAMIRDERVHPIETPDQRRPLERKGKRVFRDAVRNKSGGYEHCADRSMIRDEFAKLWSAQKNLGGPTAALLTDTLRLKLDDESGDATWRHKGLLFGQRRQTWDLGTLGRCVLHPTERCVPHADMYASRFLVVETVNNLKIIEKGKEARALTPEEREKIKTYLSGPLGLEKPRKSKGQKEEPVPRPKATVSVTDLRNFMRWGKATKSSPLRFNIEADKDRLINTDWFNREIVHGAIGVEAWDRMDGRIREGINRAILKFEPEDDAHHLKLKYGVMSWAGLTEQQADALVAVWTRRPKTDAKRLNISRRAVRNLLTVMDSPEPWLDSKREGQSKWLTEIESRKLIAGDGVFKDVTNGQEFDELTRRRYATGAKGATARDRYYMRQHLLTKDGEPIYGPDGLPLAEPPPAPMVSNPVVRKAIHEVRRHVVAYMTRFGRKPDEVYIELAREARMGAKDSDRLLFKNRLRNRIRNDILRELDLESHTTTQQRAAVDRVVLCIQQNGVCPLCGNQVVNTRLTSRMAAHGEDCEIAHIIPRASGGHNGLGNIVLAHTKCNREMGRRTPREFWSQLFKGGFDESLRHVEGIYGDIQRPKPSEIKNANGDALWSCYFTQREDHGKINQFKKDIKDIQEMTNRQEAVTKYASRQVMAYLADALFDGKGLPERSTGPSEGGDNKRRIFATDGMWTSRLRREWGLFFDPHGFKSKGLSNEQEHERKEKNRGDHHHHAIDAVVIALSTRNTQIAWEDREKKADKQLTNPADEVEMENYRRRNPLSPPPQYNSRDEFREAVRKSIFGQGQPGRPICHRPAKRKLTGALHEETLFGPILDEQGQLTGNYTARKSVLNLDPNHLECPRPETEKQAVERLTKRRIRSQGIDDKSARKWAKATVASPGFKPLMIDPPPGKSGLVRDPDLRKRLRQCIEEAGMDPDKFTSSQVKKLFEAGKFCQASGVPIKSVVLIRVMSDPVIINRKRPDHETGRLVRDTNPTSQRAYVGGNNHHIEIRVAKNKKGVEKWSGQIVTTFEAAQRKLAKLREFRKANIPKPVEFKKLTKADRAKLTPTLRRIEQDHPIVDRNDDDAKGGRFVMSLSEGETLLMKHKDAGEVGYFVVAKLDKPQGIVLVPHWDARAAGERKDSEGNKVPDSKRDSFTATPNDLTTLAPPGHPHAVKIHVDPLGQATVLERD